MKQVDWCSSLVPSLSQVHLEATPLISKDQLVGSLCLALSCTFVPALPRAVAQRLDADPKAPPKV